MTVSEIKSAIEAVLFASGDSVELSRIEESLEITKEESEEAIKSLIEDYNKSDRGLKIVKLNESYQMSTKKEHAPVIRTVMDMRRNMPLSQAALEVLAVVAYNQPVTKAFIEQIRGVDCSGVIGSLTTKDLIEEKGRLELPGRPLLYGTTENFLRCFSISELEELPSLPKKDDEDQDENEDSNEKNEINEENKEQSAQMAFKM